MSLTAIAFWLLYIGGCVGALLYPAIGVLLYVLVYHLHPESQWWGGSFAATGLRSSLTVALATVIGIALRKTELNPPARQFPPTLVLALCFAGLVAASLLVGYGPSERGVYQAEKIVKLMIFLIIMIRCIRTPEAYHWLLVAWIVGVAYVGYQANGNVGVTFYGRLMRGVGGPDFSDSSDLALHMVTSLPLIGVLLFQFRGWLPRVLLLGAGVLTVNTIVMTRTRNVAIALFVMAVIAVLSLPRGYRVRGLLVLVVGAALSWQLVDPGWIERMRTITNYEADASATSRIAYWTSAVEMSLSRPFGMGIGNFQRAIQEYREDVDIPRSAHNTYFECLAETGVLGLLLFGGTMLLALRGLRYSQQRGTRRGLRTSLTAVRALPADFVLSLHALALRCAIIGYLAGAFFVTRFTAEDLWLLIGMSCCLRNIAATMEADEIAAPAPVAAVSQAAGHTPQGAPA